MTEVIAAIAACVAAVFAGLAWWSNDRARKAGEREATATESANDVAKRANRTADEANRLATEANEIAREAAQESRAAHQLQAAQHHVQSRPNVTLTVEQLPSKAGFLEVQIWSDAAFDAGTLTLPREFIPDFFAGFAPGPDEPDRHEFTHSVELPATEAGSSVSRWLYVYNPPDLTEADIRLLCELRITDRPAWQYVLPYTFPAVASPNVW